MDTSRPALLRHQTLSTVVYKVLRGGGFLSCSGQPGGCSVARVLLLASLLTIPVRAAEVEDLGVAIRAVVFGNSQGCLAQSPAGNADMFYIPYFSTTGGELIGIHSGSGEQVQIKLPSKGGYGTAVQTLASLGGKIYGSTYINMHMFGIEPETKAIEDLGKVVRWGGQVDSMHAGRDGKLYMGSYVHAVVSIYDP